MKSKYKEVNEITEMIRNKDKILAALLYRIELELKYLSNITKALDKKMYTHVHKIDENGEILPIKSKVRLNN